MITNYVEYTSIVSGSVYRNSYINVGFFVLDNEEETKVDTIF